MNPKHEAAAVILAGGKSTRMGRDKASEAVAGKPMLQHVIDRCSDLVGECVVVTARGQTLPDLDTKVPLRVVEDLYPGAGPLGGLYTGLTVMEHPVALALGCDTPLLRPELLQALLRQASGREAVAPLREGMPQPLCAVYARRCAEPARLRLDRGDYRLTDLFNDLDALLLPEGEWRAIDPDGLSFLNLNTPADLARAESLLRAEDAEP